MKDYIIRTRPGGDCTYTQSIDNHRLIVFAFMLLNYNNLIELLSFSLKRVVVQQKIGDRDRSAAIVLRRSVVTVRKLYIKNCASPDS